LVDGIIERLNRRLTACAVLSALLVCASELHADELGPTLLSYRAVDGCPEVLEFQRSVQRRSSRIRFVDEGSHDRELSIVLRKEGDFTSGELRLIERDGTLRQRNVRFTTCAEAVEGLALITAVSLDPEALLQPAPTARVEPTPAPAPTPAAPQPAPRKIQKARPAAPASTIEAAVGAEFNAAFRALPSTAIGGALFVDILSTSRSFLAPSFRGALSHVERRGIAEGGSETNFTLTLLTVSACPLRVGDGALVLRPCAFASGGALHAWGSSSAGSSSAGSSSAGSSSAGSSSESPQTRTRPYLAWGGSAQVFLRTSQTIEIVADIGIGSTLIRDRFVFEQAQFWKTPALYLSSGLGLRFVFR